MSKIIVMRMSLDVLLEVREEDDTEFAEFVYNDSTHCTDNEIEALAANLEDGSCLSCASSEFKFLRVATPWDLENIVKAYKDE